MKSNDARKVKQEGYKNRAFDSFNEIESERLSDLIRERGKDIKDDDLGDTGDLIGVVKEIEGYSNSIGKSNPSLYTLGFQLPKSDYLEEDADFIERKKYQLEEEKIIDNKVSLHNLQVSKLIN